MSEFDSVDDFLSKEREILGDLGEDLNFHDSTDFHADPVATNPEAGATEPNGSYVIFNGSPAANVSSSPTLSTSVEQITNGATVETKQSPAPSELWRAAFQERISAKDAEEERLIKELRETGKNQLDTWYSRYTQKLQNRFAELREEQSTQINGQQPSDVGKKPGVGDRAVWEKVCNMCDFQTRTKSTTDLSRMRGVLLSLKPSS